MIERLARVTGVERVLRSLRRIEEGIRKVTEQNDEVLQIAEDLRTDNAAMRTALTGIAGDVAGLKSQIDALPAGQPLDEQTLANLRDAAAEAHENANAAAGIDESTPAVEPDPNA